MELSDYLSALRRRWIVVVVAVVVGIAGALVATAVAEREYESTTKMIVSVAASGTPAETYQGGMYAQSRVVPFIELLEGQTVAARTVEALGLDMSADDVRSEITAKSEAQSVVISLTVRDASAQRAADIANGAAEQFIRLARTAETPADGGGPLSIVKVVEPATVSQGAVSPNGKRNLALGLLVGLLAGIAGAVAIDRSRPRRSPAAPTTDSVSATDTDSTVVRDDRTEHASSVDTSDTRETGTDESRTDRYGDELDDFAWLPLSNRTNAPEK